MSCQKCGDEHSTMACDDEGDQPKSKAQIHWNGGRAVSDLEKRLIEIERRCESAYPGPWSNVDTSGWHQPCVFVGLVPVGEKWSAGKHYAIANLCSTVGNLESEKANAEFIAHAREDVPFLVAELLKALNTAKDGAP